MDGVLHDIKGLYLHRYKIFAAVEIATVPENKKSSKKCLEKSGLSKDLFRTGKTKVRIV